MPFNCGWRRVCPWCHPICYGFVPPQVYNLSANSPGHHKQGNFFLIFNLLLLLGFKLWYVIMNSYHTTDGLLVVSHSTNAFIRINANQTAGKP